MTAAKFVTWVKNRKDDYPHLAVETANYRRMFPKKPATVRSVESEAQSSHIAAAI